MADEHAPFKTPPCKVAWWLQATWMQEEACVVHDVGIAIYHGGLIAVFQFLGDVFQGGLVKQLVTGIEEDDIVTSYEIHGLVHGVIEAVIFLAVYYDALVFLGILLYNRQGAVAGTAVHYDVLVIWIYLLCYALHSASQQHTSVIGTCYNRESYHTQKIACKFTI